METDRQGERISRAVRVYSRICNICAHLQRYPDKVGHKHRGKDGVQRGGRRVDGLQEKCGGEARAGRGHEQSVAAELSGADDFGTDHAHHLRGVGFRV